MLDAEEECACVQQQQLEQEAKQQYKEKSRIELSKPSVFTSNAIEVSRKKRKIVGAVLEISAGPGNPDADGHWATAVHQMVQPTSAEQRNLILQSLGVDGNKEIGVDDNKDDSTLKEEDKSCEEEDSNSMP